MIGGRGAAIYRLRHSEAKSFGDFLVNLNFPPSGDQEFSMPSAYGCKRLEGFLGEILKGCEILEKLFRFEFEFPVSAKSFWDFPMQI